MKPVRNLPIIALILSLATPIIAADVKGTPEDEVAIRSVLAAYQTAFARHDLKAVMILYAESAELVTRTGRYLKGRSEIEPHLALLFRGLFKDAKPTPPSDSWIKSTRFLRPDVAMVHGVGEANIPGVPAGSIFVGSYVMIKEEGKWLIAGQDNIVGRPAPEPGSKP